MTSVIAVPATLNTVGELLQHLGGVPADRVRLHPAPGSATEKDVLEIHAREKRLCELVDGVLVEKPMGYYESRLAMLLGHFIQAFLDQHDLGIVAGPDGMLRLAAGLVRIPDVSFVSWTRLPGRRIPRQPIPDLVPDLAVEVLSPGNTEREMARKLDEYFAAGVRLVWFVDPSARTVVVYTSPGESVVLGANDVLEGVPVLPGFSLAVNKLIEQPAP